MKSNFLRLLAVITILTMVFSPASAQTGLTASSQAASKPAAPASGLPSGAKLSYAPQTGKISFMSLTVDQAQRLDAQLGASNAERASATFIQQYGAFFGISDASQLQLIKVSSDNAGFTHRVYSQVYQGLPVYGTRFQIHQNAQGLISVANGVVIPDIAVSVTPSLSQADAEAAGLKEAGVAGGAVKSATLMIYRLGLAQGVPGDNRLAYEVTVTSDTDRKFVYVDAQSGKVLDKIEGVETAIHRRAYKGSLSSANLIWEDGMPPYSGGDIEISHIITNAWYPYEIYKNLSGGTYLSYDGADAIMHTIASYSEPGWCPNASWNGTSTQFCDGMTSPDTVGHEWGHAYTEYTHGLIYAWQPGAMSEAYSDITGEIVDMVYGMNDPDTLRTEGACSVDTPLPALLVVNSPAGIAGNYGAGSANFGAPLSYPGLTGDVVLAEDGVASPDVHDGCEALTNGAAVAGKIVLINRGTCNFTVKAKNGQDAGAAGVIIGNVASSGNPNVPPSMGGDDPTITIPVLSINYPDNMTIQGALPGVNATLTVDAPEGGLDNSVRWLSGQLDNEGAIRDLWTPSCYGLPDRVSDPLYYCSTADGGGVHYNTGVVTKAFALLVDGSTFNGQTITGIGLTKVAHIYWRAESVYQTPSTSFADHADALEQSCQDLKGQNLTDLKTGAASGEIITDNDCAQLAKVITATELRTPPSQCNFQPLLQQPAPDLCPGANGPVQSVKLETFDVQPAGWTVTHSDVYSVSQVNWQWINSLPGGRTGGAYYALDGDGNCSTGAGDATRLLRLVSPVITLPAGTTVPRVAFTHYVATEASYDGGNLEVKVNGASWTLVPKSAYTFNPYNGTMAAGDVLSGQPAFTGADGGNVTGSWGQSQVDLSSFAVGGDTVQFRWNFGNDGCGAIDGWYVDDVNVYYCQNQINAPTPSLDKTGVTSVQATNDTQVQTFHISNLGAQALNWVVYEGTGKPGLVLPAAEDQTLAPTACTSVPIPWASLTPASGTTPFANASPVQVTFDSTGLALGTYNGSLCMTFNSPTSPQLTLPVTLTVTPAASFAPAAYDVTETDGASEATITVTLNTAGSTEIKVHYDATAGTAVEGSDFTAVSGELTFAAGELAKTFTVPILGDRKVEPDETVLLTLSSPTGGALGVSQGTLTIKDNDQYVDLAVDQTGPAAVTPGAVMTYTLTVSNAGPGGATALVVSDELPAGAVFVSGSAGCALDAGKVVCNVASLASGAQTVLTVVVKAPAAPGPQAATATVTSAESDSDPSNNTGAHSVTVNPRIFIPFCAIVN